MRRMTSAFGSERNVYVYPAFWHRSRDNSGVPKLIAEAHGEEAEEAQDRA